MCCACVYVHCQIVILSLQEKLGSSVRSVLNEQLGRVQIKHVAEIEVLDEMRSATQT